MCFTATVISQSRNIPHMYLPYYVHLAGIKAVTDCKNAWGRKMQKNETEQSAFLKIQFFWDVTQCQLVTNIQGALDHEDKDIMLL